MEVVLVALVAITMAVTEVITRDTIRVEVEAEAMEETVMIATVMVSIFGLTTSTAWTNHK